MSSLKLVPLVLTDAGREALGLLVRRRTAARRLDRTAPILLMLPTNPRPSDPGTSEVSLLP
jgi:hypothetical protein